MVLSIMNIKDNKPQEKFDSNIVFRTDLSWEYQQEEEIFQILTFSIGEIFDSFDFNVFIIDEDGIYRYVNSHYLKIVEKTKQQVIWKHLSEVLDPSLIEKYEKWKETLLAKWWRFGNKYKDPQRYTSPNWSPHLFDTKKTLLSEKNMYYKSFKLWGKRMFLGTGIDVIDFENTERDLKCLIEALNISKKKYEDGLKAAQSIQQDSLPSLEYITECFPQHSLVYYPKHIVSWDFYWISKIGEEFITAIGDCTWHGMSWAMMSISAIWSLNEIVKIKSIHDPIEILKELDKKMERDFNAKQKILQKEGKINLDNLDISLCRIDPINKKLILSLVNSKAYLWKNNNLIELWTHIKWSESTYNITEEDSILYSKWKSLQTYYLPIDEWDILYMFTDGYKDQFGSDKKKDVNPERFWKLRFKKLIENIAHLPLQDQNIIIKEDINNWKWVNNQTDDITVFGIKLL